MEISMPQLAMSFLSGLAGLGLGYYLRTFSRSAAIAASSTPSSGTSTASPSADENFNSDDLRGDVKMVLVVRQDLKMGKGKGTLPSKKF